MNARNLTAVQLWTPLVAGGNARRQTCGVRGTSKMVILMSLLHTRLRSVTGAGLRSHGQERPDDNKVYTVYGRTA